MTEKKESLLLRIFPHRRKVHSIGKCTRRAQEPALRFTSSPPPLQTYRQPPPFALLEILYSWRASTLRWLPPSAPPSSSLSSCRRRCDRNDSKKRIITRQSQEKILLLMCARVTSFSFLRNRVTDVTIFCASSREKYFFKLTTLLFDSSVFLVPLIIIIIIFIVSPLFSRDNRSWIWLDRGIVGVSILQIKSVKSRISLKTISLDYCHVANVKKKHHRMANPR